MSTLSLWYDMDVRYSSNAVKDVRLSSALERFDDIRELLYFFEKISDLRFDINGKEIYVRKKR